MEMCHIIKYIAFVLLVSTSAIADVSPIVVAADFNLAHVNHRAVSYTDPSNALSISDIRSIQDEFTPYDDRIFKGIYSSSSIWYRFMISNTTENMMPLLLECQYPQLDYLSLYYYHKDRFENEIHTGDELPFERRPIPHENFVFPISAAPGVTTCFLKVKSTSPVSFPMYIYSQDGFERKKNTAHFSTGILVGYVLFYMIFFIFVFFYSRKMIFFASMLIVLSMGAGALHEIGFFYRYLYPDNSVLNNLALLINLMVGLFVFLMAVNCFETQHRHRRFFKKYSKIVQIGAVFLSVLIFFIDFGVAKIIIYAYFLFNLTFTYIFVIILFGADPLYRPAIMGYTVMLLFIYIDSIFHNLIANDFFSARFNHLIRPTFALISFTLWGMGLMIVGGQSHRKREIAEQELIRKIKKSEELQTEFINDLTHELATPLQTIMYSTEKITRLKMEEALATYINRIQSASNRISTLIKNFLDSARSDNYKLNMNFQEEDLEIIIKNIIFELGTLASETRHDIILKTEADSRPGTYRLLIDKIYIEQSIFNIITNSIKYTPKQGKILVQLKKTAKKITISIADNGYGIPETAALAIFEPYYRVGFINPFSAGVGLGLSISKKWVEAHGGWIECKSPLPAPYNKMLNVDDVRKGSIFIIHLPLHAAAPPHTP